MRRPIACTTMWALRVGLELGDRLAFREFARTAAAGSSLEYLDWTDEDPGRLNEVEINVGRVVDHGFDAVLKTTLLSMDVVHDRTQWRPADATRLERQAVVRYVARMGLTDETAGFQTPIMQQLQTGWPRLIALESTPASVSAPERAAGLFGPAAAV